MAGFDEAGVYYSDTLLANGENLNSNEAIKNPQLIIRKFKEFLREYHEGNFIYKYREQLKNHYSIGQYWIEVANEDLTSFDEDLASKLTKCPSEYLTLFEEAAKEVADEVTRPRAVIKDGDDGHVKDIQVMIISDSNPISFRSLKSDYISRLVRISAIVISASSVRAKANSITLKCKGCMEMISNIPIKPGLEGYLMPRKCSSDQTGRTVKCPLDPFYIIPDKCKCSDFQILKLQEAPECIPQAEMPRHLLVYCDRYLCEKAVPGNRVTIVGIYSIKKLSKPVRSSGSDKSNIGIRSPYLRAVGINVANETSGHASIIPITSEEEELFRHLASTSNIYERIAKSIAPSIYGFQNIKKAIACLLFSGSRKRLPDGLTRRGDINVLLLGDPGTAKSQLLKFVEKVAPIGVYTSGKGSSAAGLTASVIRDPSSRGFVMEGGAMVLADGGCVCIDEFDKMREDDRVAIHEAMEQQTISIAKAGITTTLNSRCSVLAAANSVFGRWDDSKADENIDFMPTILARFDMIFIVKDEHNEKRDVTLARHVMDVHMNAQKTVNETEGELSLELLKKYISFCRSTCGPRLSEKAAKKLSRSYVEMRNGCRDMEMQMHKKSSIPLTIRQLEAIIRISESLAKMELQSFVSDKHVEEAIRLFKCSTIQAASSGDLAGAEGFTSEEEHAEMVRIEKQVKRRFPVGSQISQSSIIEDMVKQGFKEQTVVRVLQYLLRKGDFQHRMQRKMLYRLK